MYRKRGARILFLYSCFVFFCNFFFLYFDTRTKSYIKLQKRTLAKHHMYFILIKRIFFSFRFVSFFFIEFFFSVLWRCVMFWVYKFILYCFFLFLFLLSRKYRKVFFLFCSLVLSGRFVFLIPILNRRALCPLKTNRFNTKFVFLCNSLQSCCL